MNKNQGFTLIELLVVVLIIGILSSVALPQYERAVMKTRTMSLMPMLRAIDSAEQIYYLANGTYTMSFDDLDISLPEGATVTRETNKEAFSYHNWECYLRRAETGTIASHSAYCFSTMDGMPQLEKYFSKDHFVCWGGPEGTKTYNLCKSIANTSTPTYSKTTGDRGFSVK